MTTGRSKHIVACAEAMEWLKNNSAAVALLDLHLLDGSCEPVARRLVAKGIPFIVLSGDDERNAALDSIFAAGAWLDKPAPPDRIVTAVRGTLNPLPHASVTWNGTKLGKPRSPGASRHRPRIPGDIMNKLIIASLIATVTSFGAMAQTATTSPKPAPTAPADANAPLPGANSFTEAQAKSRLEANGYTNVTDLKKDDNGVWKGKATNSGASVNVSVDYRGNIVKN